MLGYQIGDMICLVKGTLPKAIPDIQVGFEGDAPVLLFGGVKIPTSSAGGTVEMSDTIPFNGTDMVVSNPELTAEIRDGDYYIGGTMAVADPAVLKAWGYDDTVKNVFVVKVIFDTSAFGGEITAENFAGECVGLVTKDISFAKFDGPDYIYYIFAGSTKTITITYWNTSDKAGTTKTITIHNDAVLATDGETVTEETPVEDGEEEVQE